jgi:hypothetical protein
MMEFAVARLNSEYGSELHLLRMLGRHRDYFDRKVGKLVRLYSRTGNDLTFRFPLIVEAIANSGVLIRKQGNSPG